MTRRWLVLTFTWVAFLAHGLSGQQGQPAQPAPVFRADVDAVELDVFVTDQRGNPVKDLTAGDFRLEEDGVLQSIMSFSTVDVRLNAGGAVTAVAGVEPDVRTNRKPGGRLYVFAIDDLSPGLDLRTRHFLRHFIAEHFTGDDAAALIYLSYAQARNTQDFTSSAPLLLRAVDRITSSTGSPSPDGLAGASPMIRPVAQPNFAGGSRIRTESLRALMESLAQVKGRRKVVLYFTQGLGMDVLDALDRAGGTRSIAFDDLHAALSAATRGNIAVYPINPAGLTLNGSLSEAVDLRALAYSTGAEAVVNTNTIPDALARIVRDNSTYYVLGYSSTSTRREGRFRKIAVSVSRPGLMVRTRRGYLEPQRHAPKQAVTTIPTLPIGLANALAQPLAAPAVPMQAFAAAYRAGDGRASVVIAQDIDATALGLVQTGEVLSGNVATATLAVRFDGKIYGGKAQSAPVTIEGAATSTVRVVSEINVPPGRYQLRVAGGTDDRAGSVMYDLDVPDFSKASLSMSGVALTSTSAGDATIVDLSPGKLSGLPSPITTTREFGSSETVTLYTEVYENGRKAGAHTVDVTTTLRTAAGRALRAVNQQRTSTALAGGQNGFTVSVPLSGTPPGDYVLHLEAQARVDDGDIISRDIPLRIR